MRAILGRIGLLSALLARAHGITSGSALGPASSPKPRCRLFVESSPLQAGVRVQLSEGQQHYLMSVMRVSDQATVLLFDGHSGEWLARINREGRRGCTSTPLEQTRPQPSSPAVIALHFALLKPKRLAQLVEKATELGVTQLQPLVTSRTAVRSISIEKLRAIVIEAAEQCGRLSVPEVFDLNEDLESCLRAARATAGAAVFACDERPGCTNRLDQALARAATDGLHAAAFVVGPEGGFDPSEFEALRVHAELVSLGPNVLRAETAAMSALAVMHCRL